VIAVFSFHCISESEIVHERLQGQSGHDPLKLWAKPVPVVDILPFSVRFRHKCYCLISVERVLWILCIKIILSFACLRESTANIRLAAT